MHEAHEKRKQLSERKKRWFQEKTHSAIRKKVESDISSSTTMSSKHNAENKSSTISRSSPEIDQGKIINMITNVLEDKLRESLRHEIRHEVNFDQNSRRKEHQEVDTALRDEIANHCCPICFEMMLAPDNTPIMLYPCGHNFCDDCLKTMLVKHGHRKCPTCRTPIKTQTVNISLKQIIETYIHQERSLKKTPPPPKTSQINPQFSKSPNDTILTPSFEKNLLRFVSESDLPIVANYLNAFRRYSVRKDILTGELSETSTELTSLLHDASLVETEISSLENEKLLILQDIETLKKGLLKLNNELDTLEHTATSIESHSKDLYRKQSLLKQTISTVSSSVDKNQLILGKQFNIPPFLLQEFLEQL